jgi:hypothetical protein
MLLHSHLLYYIIPPDFPRISTRPLSAYFCPHIFEDRRQQSSFLPRYVLLSACLRGSSSAIIFPSALRTSISISSRIGVSSHLFRAAFFSQHVFGKWRQQSSSLPGYLILSACLRGMTSAIIFPSALPTSISVSSRNDVSNHLPFRATYFYQRVFEEWRHQPSSLPRYVLLSASLRGSSSAIIFPSGLPTSISVSSRIVVSNHLPFRATYP